MAEIPLADAARVLSALLPGLKWSRVERSWRSFAAPLGSGVYIRADVPDYEGSAWTFVVLLGDVARGTKGGTQIAMGAGVDPAEGLRWCVSNLGRKATQWEKRLIGANAALAKLDASL